MDPETRTEKSLQTGAKEVTPYRMELQECLFKHRRGRKMDYIVVKINYFQTLLLHKQPALLQNAHHI